MAPPFTPDVDVRTTMASTFASSKQSTLYNYWDRNKNQIEYDESSAPSSVNFYFYPREYTENILMIGQFFLEVSDIKIQNIFYLT